MTKEEVETIVMQTLNKKGLSISKLTSFKPKMKTTEVVKYLECDRKWLYNNRDVFNGRRKNSRGDYEFDTEKVVNYKIKKALI
ncbi:hypothetical protein [Salegentibacter sp. UBA1130]|uniref:hypothetical protein n=1 Tax=Salegentibacter sp. UBA1130 TaxID=1947451 RepID=UPI00258117D8|nr:hypothetical protein [Salegentibacter sp. UBA1130]